MVVAALTLGLLFLFPMWRITLLAPQYPDGITMDIWVNAITGDVANINIMNHYVGMRDIDASSFPELTYFQFIIIGMIALGLIIAWKGKRLHVWIWAGGLALLGILGLYDFYLWEVDYGHNLNPNAAIKIPGMVYQPPFIGRKELLNFIAYSMPGVGGLAIGVSIILGMIAASLRGKRVTTTSDSLD